MTVKTTETRTVNPNGGRERADELGLISIDGYWELYCHDCGYRDPDAYVVSVCPSCGGPKAGARLPPVDELLNGLTDAGLSDTDIAKMSALSSTAPRNWLDGDAEPRFSSHEELAKLHYEKVR